jgi:ectoine hydroxylase-related dioxygenase (phytanoyl-CoA dioxygenase family)
VSEVRDRMPALDSVYDLPADARARFERDGHVALPGVLSPGELHACREAVRAAVAANIEQEHALTDDVGAKANNWQFVNNLWTQSDEVRALIHSPRLARIAAELLGEARLRLFRDQSYFKGPGGAGTPWHQDATFIPLDTPAILTAWIALSDMSPESSPMTYATGSHHHGFQGLCPGGDGPMRAFQSRLADKGFGFETYDGLKAGDVAFHAAWTMHATYAHSAPVSREAVVIVYFADGAHVVIDPPAGTPGAPWPHVAQVRANSRAISFPGLDHGAIAEGAMTPLLYDRAAEV